MTISLADAKYHLRIDGSEQDAEVNTKLNHAEMIVRTYRGFVDAYPSTEDPIRDAATLLVLGELWANRESSTGNPLSPSVRNILDTIRGPSWA
ncbi:head-tail connector protein [Aromatoleum aromaticum]|uniref:Phage gp6-like head-tail connector protein n=1 Tax=Aromatoleum aromaticum (strain DSM 19018 / LMG 30748 / EbN1) TaxID=76114 RepID=Q5P0B8_AROAE|nr:head-tail connector protein [Aromatoleum aromaticum]NMG56724.1 hypothetical protein [Aromatoleum aromaticum]CAI09246.1 hypothetical protein ebD94 [Aromatoleum aromaticum EbN1]